MNSIQRRLASFAAIAALGTAMLAIAGPASASTADATAAVTTTAPTCSTGAHVSLGDIANATWGTPVETKTTYSVVATAAAGFTFAGGKATQTFTGALGPKLSADSCRTVVTIAWPQATAATCIGPGGISPDFTTWSPAENPNGYEGPGYHLYVSPAYAGPGTYTLTALRIGDAGTGDYPFGTWFDGSGSPTKTAQTRTVTVAPQMSGSSCLTTVTPPAPVWVDACGIDGNGAWQFTSTARYTYAVTTSATGEATVVATPGSGYQFPASDPAPQWTHVQDDSRCPVAPPALTVTNQTCTPAGDGATFTPGAVAVASGAGVSTVYVYLNGTKVANKGSLAPGTYSVIANATAGYEFAPPLAGWAWSVGPAGKAKVSTSFTVTSAADCTVAPTTPAAPTAPVTPTVPAVPAEDDLTPETQGNITVTDGATPGGQIGVTVDGFAGQQVDLVLFSAPTSLGRVTLSSAGFAIVTIPADATPGAHRMAAYDTSGTLIGWVPFTVTQPFVAALSSGGAAPSTASTVMADEPVLAATGSSSALVAGLATLILAGGLVLVWLRRRARA